MARYILKRLLMMIIVVWGVLTIVFILNEITPGDAAIQFAGPEATQEQIEMLRVKLGLDKPPLTRYVKYIVGLVTRGDLGTSYTTMEPVMGEILARYPTTLKLTIFSFIFSVCVGVPIGIVSATRQYSWIDNASMAVSMFGVSVPQFWLGLMLIILFAVRKNWLPAFGVSDPRGWILPTVTLGLTSAASIARTTRSAMLDVIRQDYVRTARAKGQTEWKVTWKHALRNALIPIITVLGITLGVMLGGAVIIEQVFSVSGLGKYIVDAVRAQNYPAVQGGVVFLALVFSFVNLFVDIIYAFFDPRIKAQNNFTRQRKQRPMAVKGGES